MSTATILFPHQLFKENPAVNADRPIDLAEEELTSTSIPFTSRSSFFTGPP
ncbi:MAG: hypothetical protein U5K69_13445 [Balneolaceae bacterium]|nr:hypothetical protein [Balneolaceae bacterium]